MSLVSMSIIANDRDLAGTAVCGSIAVRTPMVEGRNVGDTMCINVRSDDKLDVGDQLAMTPDACDGTGNRARRTTGEREDRSSTIPSQDGRTTTYTHDIGLGMSIGDGGFDLAVVNTWVRSPAALDRPEILPRFIGPSSRTA